MGLTHSKIACSAPAWAADSRPVEGDRTAARAEILESAMALADWYRQTGQALAGDGAVPAPVLHDPLADGRLLDAVHRDLSGDDGSGTATAVKMIWTADHIDAVRRLQPGILAPARAVVAARPVNLRRRAAGRARPRD